MTAKLARLTSRPRVWLGPGRIAVGVIVRVPQHERCADQEQRAGEDLSRLARQQGQQGAGRHGHAGVQQEGGSHPREHVASRYLVPSTRLASAVFSGTSAMNTMPKHAAAMPGFTRLAFQAFSVHSRWTPSAHVGGGRPDTLAANSHLRAQLSTETHRAFPMICTGSSTGRS